MGPKKLVEDNIVETKKEVTEIKPVVKGCIHTRNTKTKDKIELGGVWGLRRQSYVPDLAAKGFKCMVCGKLYKQKLKEWEIRASVVVTCSKEEISDVWSV